MSEFLFKENKFLENKIHLLFLILLSLKYIIPLLIFNQITLFYLDTLDIEIVYNTIIGKIIGGDFEAVKIFLNGEIKIEYLRRLFHPYMIVYSIFNTELAYWLIDILLKLVSYFSFFLLAKKINPNLLICGLVSCLFASSNLPSHEGFGLAILPYLSYLILYKDNLKFKHHFIIIFFGLNSDLIMTGIGIPVITLFFFLFIKKEKYIHFLKILILFSICIIIANWNIIFTSFQDEILHRVEMTRQSNSLYLSIISLILDLFKIPKNYNLNFSLLLFQLPSFLFVFPLMIGFLFSSERRIRIPIYVIILTICFLRIIEIEIIANYINNSRNFLKTISWSYLERPFIFLYAFSIIYMLKRKNFYNKILIYCIFLSIMLFQISPSLIPFVKDKIIKVENYQNLYTFKGYYNYYDYQSVKKIVKNKRTISVGLDPMVAAFHNIGVIDGYYTLYPLSYKKKFRKIIEKELDQNQEFKNYYDNWGSRVYSVLYHPKDLNNIPLDFQAAKILGANFVISKYLLNSEDLSLIDNKCIEKNFCLYRIN